MEDKSNKSNGSEKNSAGGAVSNFIRGLIGGIVGVVSTAIDKVGDTLIDVGKNLNGGSAPGTIGPTLLFNALYRPIQGINEHRAEAKKEEAIREAAKKAESGKEQEPPKEVTEAINKAVRDADINVEPASLQDAGNLTPPETPPVEQDRGAGRSSGR